MSESFDLVMKEFERVQGRIDELKPILKMNKEALAEAKAAENKERVAELKIERDRIEAQLHPLKEDIYALNIKAQEFKPGFDWFDHLRAKAKAEAEAKARAEAEAQVPTPGSPETPQPQAGA